MMPLQNTRVIYIITGLNLGGAEKFLVNYIINYVKSDNVIVISLKRNGKLENILLKKKIKVLHIDLNLNFFPSFFAAINNIKKFKPHIVSAFMYHACIVSFLLSFFIKYKKLFFFIRSTVNQISDYKFSTRFVILICSFLSNWTTATIYNSKIGIKNHERYGFNKSKSIYLPNGYKIEDYPFEKKSEINLYMRNELKISVNQKIIGFMARNHSMKGFEIFLKSINQILLKYKNVYVLILGRNNENSNHINLIDDSIRSRVKFIGEVLDPIKYVCTFDLFVNSSINFEGFSNAISENSLMGVPSIATDIGDSKIIIGNNGIVIDPGNYEQLQLAIEKYLIMNKLKLSKIGESARLRIIENFPMKKFIDKINVLYG